MPGSDDSDFPLQRPRGALLSRPGASAGASAFVSVLVSALVSPAASVPESLLPPPAAELAIPMTTSAARMMNQVRL